MSGPDGVLTMSLQCPALFKDTESLRRPFIESAIKSDLLSKPLGSHEALHFFLEKLSNETTQPLIKQAIINAFRSPSLRQEIEVKWNLSPSYGCAKRRQHTMDKGAPYDLASWCIENCPQCFNLLLDHQTIQPASFCQNGLSFFWLAVRSGKIDLMQRVVSLMDPKDLLHPFSLREPEEDQYTIFQASTWNRKWFQVCWARLKSCQDNGLTSLGPRETGHICLFADVDLANELLDSGLDLGNPHPKNASPGWLEIVGRMDPEPMLNWFLSRGHQPPEKLLKYAATHNCTYAASWIMRNAANRQEWRDAALIAAESADRRSSDMLAVILQSPAARWKPDQRMSEDILIKIVDGVCEGIEEFGAISLEKLMEMEAVAVQKIEALSKVVGIVEVVGTKVKAENTGLSRLVTALENMNLHC